MSYARYWITSYISRYIENCGSVIRLPSHVNQKIIRYKKLMDRFIQENGRDATDTEIADIMGIRLDEVAVIKLYSTNMDSLDATITDDTDSTLIDVVKDDFDLENEVIDDIYDEYLKKELWGIVERNTSTRENDVVCSRYKNNETLQTIADKYNVSCEMIRQIEAAAIKKLRRGKARRELSEKIEGVDKMMYKTSVSNFKNHNFTSSVERIILRKEELVELYKSQIKKQ